jgi:hypothetical protein
MYFLLCAFSNPGLICQKIFVAKWLKQSCGGATLGGVASFKSLRDLVREAAHGLPLLS